METRATVQFVTVMAPESQSLVEQMQDRLSMVKQHFWPAPGVGQAAAAAPSSAAGISAAGPHWQKPSVESLLHANESQAQRSALPQQLPCSPECVATDELLQATTSSGCDSRAAHKH